MRSTYVENIPFVLMKKLLSALLGVRSYLAALGATVFLFDFTASDSFTIGPTLSHSSGTTGKAALTDILLLLLIGLLHGGMTRKSSQLFLRKYLPAPLLRSFYVLTNAMMILMLTQYWMKSDILLWETTEGFT